MRDLPPSIQDGKFGWEPDSESNFDDADEQNKLSPAQAESIARDAYQSSSNWLNASRRSKWADSLKAFHSVHPSGSKYLSREYAGRSSLYRPKTRTMVRKGEASTATAFFSNEDVISIRADDDDDPHQQASAEVLKALIQYRLTKTIPWFQTLVGARQDAEVMGICCAKIYWDYKEKSHGIVKRGKLDSVYQMPLLHPDGSPQLEDAEHYEVTTDEPRIDLISPENIRYDPSSDWRDPIKTSPYVIEMIPMFYQDIMAKIDSGEWFDIGGSAVRGSIEETDSTKMQREPGVQASKGGPTAFSTCWVRSNIIRWNDTDWHFYTCSGGGELLTNPAPLSTVFLHGIRPYVVGSILLETHKNYPTSKVELTRDLQRIANDDLNLRFDAVKMSLNPRQFVSAGAGIEPNDLRTFTPGKIITVRTMKGEPPASVMSWDRPPEPGPSAMQEQQANQLDFDELTGAFTNASVQASQWSQQSATGMHLMSGEASGVTEYELRVFAETFVEPVVAMLIKLEQAYETDEVILALAGNKAQLFQRYGIDKVTDDLLDCAVTTKFDLGIGATNPTMRLRAFQQAAQIIQQAFSNPVASMGLNFHEVVKEIMSHAGFRDGERFIRQGYDPVEAMQQMQQAKAGGGAGNKGAMAQQQAQAHIQAAQITSQAKLEEVKIHAQIEQMKLQAEMQKAQMVQDAENWRTKYAQDSQAQAAAVPQQAQILTQALPQIGEMTSASQQTAQHMQSIAEQLAQSNAGMSQTQANVADQQQNMANEVAQHVANSSQEAAQHHAAIATHVAAATQQIAAQHAALTDHLALMGQHMHNMHAATQAHIDQLTAQMGAPKRVVRGPDGKVTGVETVPSTGL